MERLTDEELEQLKATALASGAATNPVEQCDRLTVGYGIKHETCGQDPVQVGGTYMVRLHTKEQPYQRRFQVSERPLGLDTAWIEEPGHFVLENKRVLPRGMVASKEEKEEHEAHRIYVQCNGVTLFAIAPGQAFLGELSCDKPTAAQSIQLYSSFGSCPVNLTVFPR